MFSGHEDGLGSDNPQINQNYNMKCSKAVPLQAHVNTRPNRFAHARRTYKTLLSDDRGSAAVEAALVLPIFILAMYALFCLGDCLRVRNIVYEAFQETAYCLAEYCYAWECLSGEDGADTDASADAGAQSSASLSELAGSTLSAALANAKLREFADDTELADRYIAGGMSGVVVTRAELLDDNYVYMKLKYTIVLTVPMCGSVKIPCSERIRQRAYLGYDKTADGDSDDSYVYIAENGEVYHTSRSCYHISLSVRQISENALKSSYGNLSPCSLCTRGGYSGDVYVTDEGDRYHYSIGCSGLKRTVYRVKKSNAGGLPACSECGGN